MTVRRPSTSNGKISHIVCAERYALASVAEAEGYRVVHDADGNLLHYLNPAYAYEVVPSTRRGSSHCSTSC